MKPSVVIVGNGMVGHYFLQSLLEKAPDSFDIHIFGKEPRPAYDRVHLSEYFAGATADQLSLVDGDFYARHGVAAYFDDPVEAIDTHRKIVTSQQGQRLSYDFLILATGSYAFVPPIPGKERGLVYRTLEDLDAIQAAAANSRTGAVIGGGLLGLECANALCNLRLETHVVEMADRLMAVQLDALGGQFLQREVERLGVVVHTGKQTVAITADPAHPTASLLQFQDGSFLSVDMVVFSAGIRPYDQLARSAALAVGARGGIAINDVCQTSDPCIYAIGECAAWQDKTFGLVGPGYQMAKIAANHLLGKETSVFQGADMSTQLKLLGVQVASIGDAQGMTPNCRTVSYADQPKGIYKKLVVDQDGKQLLGAVLVGDSSDYNGLLQYHLNRIPLPEAPEALILPSAEEKPALGMDALPATAGICSCHNVTKGALCAAIDDGARTVGELKKTTLAGTGCGGCVPLVKQLLNFELKKRGIEVNEHLCEHFPYSRQQLYHLVRIGQLKTFDAVIGKHGKGLGCDICKPAVTSILAACWNDYVLKPQHAPLQDTNDRFLANIQKNGTYSVVPRIPGGEITPKQLLAIAQVADKYQLYTKITGGQRIDLFGAQLHELPLIWGELIAAGLESGHAYAKALRTVKSCVGSTWCRYGVQDSVAMALFLEHRYKGLRAPHKLKMAVSGCARECAEAQSKDVGVIATEKGWNLYVCGNGGQRPRHADLFAADLDDATLVRYIDRFFMFYIQTADRLQRTAPWLENLEGGLEYLKQVICQDSLGIGAELDAQMAAVVDTYQCEWRTTLADPVALKQFRHFVNSDAPDPQVVFVQERGQIRPAPVASRQSEVAP